MNLLPAAVNDFTRVSCSTLLNVTPKILRVLSSKLTSVNGKVISFGDHKLKAKNYGPWNRWSKSKLAKDMERVEISAGFDEDVI